MLNQFSTKLYVIAHSLKCYVYVVSIMNQFNNLNSHQIYKLLNTSLGNHAALVQPCYRFYRASFLVA